MFSFPQVHREVITEPVEIRVKAKFLKQCRRFRTNDQISFDQFQQLLTKIFQNAFEMKDVVLKYEDDEKDLIILENNEEWIEALRIAKTSEQKLLRISIIRMYFFLNQINKQ